MKNFLFITKSDFFSPDKLSCLMYPKETDKILIIFSIDLFLKSLNLWYCTVQHTYNVFKSHINFPSLFYLIYFQIIQYLKNFINNNLNIFNN